MAVDWAGRAEGCLGLTTATTFMRYHGDNTLPTTPRVLAASVSNFSCTPSSPSSCTSVYCDYAPSADTHGPEKKHDD